MENTIIKRVAILFTLVLLLSTLLSISVHAISTSCVEDHFTNLITTGTGSSEVIRTPLSEYTTEKREKFSKQTVNPIHNKKIHHSISSMMDFSFRPIRLV